MGPMDSVGQPCLFAVFSRTAGATVGSAWAKNFAGNATIPGGFAVCVSSSVVFPLGRACVSADDRRNQTCQERPWSEWPNGRSGWGAPLRGEWWPYRPGRRRCAVQFFSPDLAPSCGAWPHWHAVSQRASSCTTAPNVRSMAVATAASNMPQAKRASYSLGENLHLGFRRIESRQGLGTSGWWWKCSGNIWWNIPKNLVLTKESLGRLAQKPQNCRTASELGLQEPTIFVWLCAESLETWPHEGTCKYSNKSNARFIVRAQGLSHINWAKVTSTPWQDDLEESHINGRKSHQYVKITMAQLQQQDVSERPKS